MRNAYALLGLAFLIVFGASFVLFNRAEAPTTADHSLSEPDNTNSMSLSLTSSAFDNNGLIPSAYTCDGGNVNPPLKISGVPEGTKSLVLVMDDADIPQAVKEAMGIQKFNHWAVYELPADTTEIPAGAVGGANGTNSSGETAYTGPCPPTQYQPTEHRYSFRLYALSGHLNFIKTPTLDELETAASGMVLEQAELVGRYSRAGQ